MRLSACVTLCLGALWLLASPHASATQAGAQWTAAWATALQEIPDRAELPPLYRAPEVAGRTLREIVYPSLSGGTARLHISNRYGRMPLIIEQARIARSADGAAQTSGPGALLTFAGKPALQLPPGGEADSDPVAIAIASRAPYAISLYLGPQQRLQAWHRVAGRVNYVSSAGDHTNDTAAGAYRVRFTQSAWVASLSVAQPAAGAVVAIGDSITDGLRSTLGANRRWPDGLAGRLARSGDASMAVLNTGISGNRLLADSPCYGEKLLARFERDALAQPGVRTAIVLIGINDIDFAAMPPRRGLDCDFPHTQVSAAELIAGYRQLIAAAHRRGVRLLGGTLTPAGLPPAREAIRLEVNRWIRSGGAFDGVIDFDAALSDPARPQSLRAAYDSGDHVHPSDAGYMAMAEAVPLNLLQMNPVHTAARR